MIVEAQARSGVEESAPSPPSMAYWSADTTALAALNDAVNGLARITIMANSAKGKSAPTFDPYPRPESAYARAKSKKRWEKHESLADRMLGRNLEPEEYARQMAAQEAEQGSGAPAITR